MVASASRELQFTFNVSYPRQLRCNVALNHLITQRLHQPTCKDRVTDNTCTATIILGPNSLQLPEVSINFVKNSPYYIPKENNVPYLQLAWENWWTIKILHNGGLYRQLHSHSFSTNRYICTTKTFHSAKTWIFAVKLIKLKFFLKSVDQQNETKEWVHSIFTVAIAGQDRMSFDYPIVSKRKMIKDAWRMNFYTAYLVKSKIAQSIRGLLTTQWLRVVEFLAQFTKLDCPVHTLHQLSSPTLQSGLVETRCLLSFGLSTLNPKTLCWQNRFNFTRMYLAFATAGGCCSWRNSGIRFPYTCYKREYTQIFWRDKAVECEHLLRTRAWG